MSAILLLIVLCEYTGFYSGIYLGVGGRFYIVFCMHSLAMDSGVTTPRVFSK